MIKGRVYEGSCPQVSVLLRIRKLKGKEIDTEFVEVKMNVG